MPGLIDPSQIAGPADAATVPQPGGGGQLIDPSQISDALPDHSSGLTSDAPINISPLSIADRFKMALGNEKGNINYLRSKGYNQIEINKDNIRVQDPNNGLWYNVDPKNGGDGDAWQRTKEIIADAAEFTPTAAKVAGSLAAGVLATPATLGLGTAPASALVATGLEGYRTLLGRFVGTYEANDAETVKDLGVEALLNLGGSAIGAGAKPVASMLGKAAGGIGQALERVAPSTANAVKDTLSSTLGMISGVGQKAMRTVLDSGEEVSGALSQALRGRSKDAAVDYLKNENIGAVKQLAKNAQPALNNIYTGLKSELMDTAGESFKVDASKVINASRSDAIQAGLGHVLTPDGKPVAYSAADMLKDGIPPGYKFQLNSLESLQSVQRQTGQINPIANDPESYKLIKTLHDTMSNFSEIGMQTGKKGLNNLLEMKKVIGDTAFKLGTAADEQGLNIAKRYIAQVESHTENAMLEGMEPGVQSKYKDLMSSYSNAKDQMAPLVNALKQSRERGDAVFEPLLNKLQSRPGGNAAVKTQFDNAVSLMQQHGSNDVDAILSRIDVNDAASKFVPTFRKGIASAIGLGAAGAAIGSGHPEAAAGIAAAGMLASPRAALLGVRGVQNTAGATGISLAAKSMFDLKDMIGNLNDKSRHSLLQNPTLIDGLFQTAVRAPQAAKMIEDHMVGQGLQQAAPTPLPPQGGDQGGQ